LTDAKSGGGRYLANVEASCKCAVENLGKGGDMVNQMQQRFLAHLRSTPVRYDIVVIFGGVNDLYSNETAHRTNDRIQRDLAAMYRAARDHGAQVVAFTVAPWGGFRRWYTPTRGENTRELNAWIRDAPARGMVDVVVDAYALLSCGSPERLCDHFARPFRDGLHFGPDGHAKLGAALVDALGPKTCAKVPPTRGSAHGEDR
jgi:lysophospholipase L1-like esterase